MQCNEQNKNDTTPKEPFQHFNEQLENRRHRGEIDTHIRHRKILLVDKMSSMGGCVKLVVCAQTAPLSE